MRGVCTTCMAMFLSGAVTGTAALTMMTVKRKERLPTLWGQQAVRAVWFVAGAGAALPGSVGRLFATTTTPSTVTSSLASAWSSSRSQLADHSGFAFERECSANILVSGGEGRSAACPQLLPARRTSQALHSALKAPFAQPSRPPAMSPPLLPAMRKNKAPHSA